MYIKYIHVGMRASRLAMCRTFSSPHTNSVSIKHEFRITSSASGDRSPTFRLYALDSSRYLV